jgi:nicotinic acid mononucleotide adenylyltransferase
MAQTKLRLLIGADQALSFHRWREPREILRLARPAVLVRGEVADAEDLVGKMRGRYWSREDLDKWRECMVVVERMDVSATRVRGALRDGDVAEVERWLAPGVAAYIRERGLYG